MDAGARWRAGGALTRREGGAAGLGPRPWEPGARRAPASGFCPGSPSLASPAPRRVRGRERGESHGPGLLPGIPKPAGAAPRACLPRELTSSPAAPGTAPGRRAGLGRWACSELLSSARAEVSELRGGWPGGEEKSKLLEREETASFVAQLRARAEAARCP